MGDQVVRAAGGVVVRDDAGLEVVVVHRPKYDDWTLPKGKAHQGEDDEDCAVREVEEETGLVCRLEGEPVSVAYRDAAGRSKLARYWLMRPASGSLRAAHEVDAARWLPLAEAELILTHERERSVLRALAGG